MELVGGFVYLVELLKNMLSVVNIGVYVDIVCECVVVCEMILVVNEIVDVGYDL